MKAIDHPSAVAGEFVNADPGTGAPGTAVTAEWLNDVQRELVGTIEDAGLTPTLGVAQFYRAIIDLTYRVGDYLQTESAITPAQRWPWSTWTEVKGRVLVGRDTDQAEFAAVAQQGGAKTHVLTEAQLPSHRHRMFGNADGGTALNVNGDLTPSYKKTSGTNSEYSMEGTGAVASLGLTGEIGDSQAHNNLQPYRVVRQWRRTA